MRKSIVYILTIIKALALCCVHGGEGFVIPKGFQIPADDFDTPTQKFSLVVPHRMSTVASATPLEASVIIEAEGTDGAGKTRTFVGSGTIISTEPTSRILTCQHIGRDLKDVKWVIVRDRRSFAATQLKADQSRDLAVLSVSESWPAVAVGEKVPPVGSHVSSIGSSDGYSVEHQHQVVGLSKNEITTDGQQLSGRSGGGLFFGGNLVGVIQGRHVASNRSIYADTESIQAFLQTVPETMRSAAVVDIEFVTAPFHCGPCDKSAESFGRPNKRWPEGESLIVADGRVRITKRVGVGEWYDASFKAKNPTAGYPFFRVQTSDGVKTFFGGCTLRGLISIVDEGQQVVATPKDAGVHFSGSETVKSALRATSDYMGVGTVVKFHVERGPESLPLFERHKVPGKVDVFGRSGRIEVDISGGTKLPTHSLHAGYRIDASGRVFLKPDEFEVELAEGGKMSASPGENQKQGCVLLTLYAAFSWGYTIYEIFTPTIGLEVPASVDAAATITDGGMDIDFGKNPPCVTAEWHFLFGFFDPKYSRPLTGVSIKQEGATAQFHRSWIVKDYFIPFQ